MSRSIVRTLVIAVSCMVVALLAGTALAAARGNNVVAWAASAPTAGTPQVAPILHQVAPASRQSGPDAASPASTPTNSSYVDQETAGNGVADTDPASSEGSAVEPQNANEVGDQEMTGTISAINTDGSRFTLSTATGAVVFAVTSQTQFEDGLTALSSLHQGMNVRIDGVPQVAGYVLAIDVKGSADAIAADNSDASSPESGQ